MASESLAENILSRFERWVLAPLERQMRDGAAPYAAFLLMSIALDNLASIRYSGEIPDRVQGCVGKRYRAFIENYLPGKYKPHAALLYKGFRCRLVHEFQLDEIEIRQGDDSRAKHLAKASGDKLIVHSAELCADLMAAYQKLKSDLTGAAANPAIVREFETSGYKKWLHTEIP